MPWPAHYHIEFGGRRGIFTREIWQNGIRLAYKEEHGPTEPVGVPFTEFGVTLEKVLIQEWSYSPRRWFRDPRSWIAQDCLLEWISASWVLPNGSPDPALSMRIRYDDPRMIEYWGTLGVGPPIWGGGVMEATHPYQCAMFLRWESEVRHTGPGSHGGIYSPAPCMELGLGSGVVRPEVRTDMSKSAALLVADLGLFGQPLLGNRRYSSIVSPRAGGRRSRIDDVYVDARLDVLRKRAEHSPRFVTREHVDWEILG